MKKRLISLVLVLAMILSITSISFAEGNGPIDTITDGLNTILKNSTDALTENLKVLGNTLSELIKQTVNKFKDVNVSDWFINTVSKLVGMGGIDGYTDGTFRPNEKITRGEFTKILLSTIGYKESENVGPNKHWATNYVIKAEELKILDKGDFELDSLNTVITRYEMSKMIDRTLDVLGEERTKNATDYSKLIKDYYTIPKEYKNHVLEVYAKGIITGYTDDTFKGDRGLTRAEASTVIIRVVDKTERKVPQRPKVDPNWIEPEFEVYYTTNDKDQYDYFQIRVKNEMDYLISYEDDKYDKSYTFSTEIISPKKLKKLDFYNILDKKYYDYDVTWRYKNVKINDFPAGTIYALEDLRDCRYSDTKEKVQLKEGQELTYKVTVSNGKITKEYIIKAEFRNKKFRY